MSEKAWRRLKFWLGVLGVFAFTFYFAFRTFVFDPLEGSFGQIQTIIPRDIDFFLRKRNLAEDFVSFPEPLFFEGLSRSEGWGRFVRSRAFQRIERTYQIRLKLDELEQNLSSLPVDLLDDLIGKEMVIAGRKPPGSGRIGDFAFFSRISWKIKLGLALIQYDWIRNRFAPNLTVHSEGNGIIRLQGAAPSDLYLWRDRDLLVVSTDSWFLKKVPELLAKRGEDSFGLSAKYNDEILRFLEGESELEFFVDLKDFSNRHLGPGNWPVPEWGLAGRIAGEFFLPKAARECLSVLNFGGPIHIRSHVSLNADLLSPFQRRLYDQHPLHLSQDVLEKAKMVPRRSFFFAYLACDVGESVRALERALDQDQRRLLNDQFRSVGPYRGLLGFFSAFESAFRRNLLFMAQKNDYPKLKDDPPSDGSPDPLWAVVFSIKNREKIDEMVNFFVRNRTAFGVENIYQFDAGGGYRETEFFSQFVPGTGEMAVLPTGDTFYVSNSPKYLKDILKCRFHPTEGSRLTDEPGFEETLLEFDPSSNAFVYLNTRRYQKVLQEQIPFLAQKMFQIDYGEERRKARKKILDEQFPNYKGRPLPRDVAKELERLIDEEIERIDLALRGTGVQRIREELENYAFWLTSFPYLFVSLNTDHKKIDLEAKIVVDWK